MWLEAPESTNQEDGTFLQLLWSLNAEKADMIICWTISGVRATWLVLAVVIVEAIIGEDYATCSWDSSVKSLCLPILWTNWILFNDLSSLLSIIIIWFWAASSNMAKFFATIALGWTFSSSSSLGYICDIHHL